MLCEMNKQELTKSYSGLNPCFNGICSASNMSAKEFAEFAVLILVLMEYALRANMLAYQLSKKNFVLILVLMEYALRDSTDRRSSICMDRS